MAKYAFDEASFALMEQSCVPFAVYQFIHKRVVTLALSEGFLQLFQYTRSEAYHLMDTDMYRDTHPDDKARAANAAVRFATEGGAYDLVYRTRVDGSWHVVHAYGKHTYPEEGVRLAVVWYCDEGAYEPQSPEGVGTLTKTLSKALHEETFYRQNVYDRLTGLPKMAYFFELAQTARDQIESEGKEPALLFFNLVGMRHFNGKYGFAQGDVLLRSVAQVLSKHFGNENSCRLAQDYFAVVTATDGLEDTLHEVFLECAGLHERKTLPVWAGIYVDQHDSVDVSIACDRAKHASSHVGTPHDSGYRYFDSAMLEELNNQQYVVDNLDRALEEGWVQVYYQAIVRATNGRVCDEEALARWIDPERGLISPSDFIPVLEDAKLAYKLDLYVLDSILQKMRDQRERGLDVVPHSLNLSRTDFDRIDVVDEICRRVDAAGIGHDKLTVEITESVVGRDLEFIRRQVERFQELGFEVWMDDFGSGYSSMEVLQNVHFDLIKFDMSFLRGFDRGNESRIILTELMKMAMALGIDTLVEGVETKEQADFLREIGCNKMQGFYYTRPVPYQTILERHSQGTQIGFENPDEARYHATVGRVNLYDLSTFAREGQTSLQRYFNAIPMALIEVTGSNFRIMRCNNAYRDYMARKFGLEQLGSDVLHAMGTKDHGTSFDDALRQCTEMDSLLVIDDETGENETTHAMLKRVATNPVTGTAAVVVAILAVEDRGTQNTPVTYANIAKALSSDYRYLYYVDLDTNAFVEYSSDLAHGNLSHERHGEDFFATSRRDALELLHKDDQQNFVEAFHKERVMHDIDTYGSFSVTYRLLIGGQPHYVSLKAMRIGPQDRHLIIGVSDMDAQIRQERELQRAKTEQAAYMRVMALSDRYLVIYEVDPQTDHYLEYRASRDYVELGLTDAGEDFFEVSRAESLRILHPDDQGSFREAFTKERVLASIQDSGVFAITYRLLLAEGPTQVRLKAVLVQEPAGEKLIFGVERV